MQYKTLRPSDLKQVFNHIMAAKEISDMMSEAQGFIDQEHRQNTERVNDRLSEAVRIIRHEPDRLPDWAEKYAAPAVEHLNGFERKPGTKGITLADLSDVYTVRNEAKTEYDKFLGWRRTAVFIKVEAVGRLLDELTEKGFSDLCDSECVSGWFEEQNGDACDADGEFVSTPCWDHDDQDEAYEFAEDCSRAGHLIISF